MAAALFETCGIRTILQARTVSTPPFLGIGRACCHRRIWSDFIANIKVLLVAAAFGLATGSSDERPLASAAARKRCRFRSRRSLQQRDEWLGLLRNCDIARACEELAITT